MRGGLKVPFAGPFYWGYVGAILGLFWDNRNYYSVYWDDLQYIFQQNPVRATKTYSEEVWPRTLHPKRDCSGGSLGFRVGDMFLGVG